MNPSVVRRSIVLSIFLAGSLDAQTRVASGLPDPVVLLVILGTMALLPVVAVMLTSFVKISIVLSMIRNALGMQQIPPAQVTNGLAFVMTLFIMAPVAQDMYLQSGLRNTPGDVFALDNLTSLYNAADKAKDPLRRFLLAHAHAPDRALFMSLARRLDQGEARRQALAGVQQPTQAAQQEPASQHSQERDLATSGSPVRPRPDEEFRIIVPAFITSELKSAFQIGFLILLPFLVVDFVIANILVALGLQMLQPAMVSMPLKLLLFVLADGWYMIVKGLVLSYS